MVTCVRDCSASTETWLLATSSWPTTGWPRSATLVWHETSWTTPTTWWRATYVELNVFCHSGRIDETINADALCVMCEGASSSQVDGSWEYLRMRLHRPERRLVLRHPPVGDLLFRSGSCAEPYDICIFVSWLLAKIYDPWLGKSPYPSMAVDSRFYKMVKRGYQMSQPDFALPEM